MSNELNIIKPSIESNYTSYKVKSKSKLFASHNIYEDLWLISLTAGKNHAVILIEGLIKDNQTEQFVHYIVKCDAVLPVIAAKSSWWKNPMTVFQNTTGELEPRMKEFIYNISGERIDIKIHSAATEGKMSDFSELKRNYTSGTNRRIYYYSVNDALNIINEVSMQVHDYEAGIKQKFQKAGKYSFFNFNDGHNCVTWAEEILQKARHMPFDKIKAIPYKHVK